MVGWFVLTGLFGSVHMGIGTFGVGEGLEVKDGGYGVFVLVGVKISEMKRREGRHSKPGKSYMEDKGEVNRYERQQPRI